MAARDIPNDLMREADYAREVRKESPLTARNRRLRGEGPPYYKGKGRKSPVYVSRKEADEYWAQEAFRYVPAITAKEQALRKPAPRRRKARAATETV
jgi:hypothetical protein